MKELLMGIALYVVYRAVSAFSADMCARNISETVIIIDYPFIVAAVELGEAHQCRQQ
jgi:hypothetical protein